MIMYFNFIKVYLCLKFSRVLMGLIGQKQNTWIWGFTFGHYGLFVYSIQEPRIVV